MLSTIKGINTSRLIRLGIIAGVLLASAYLARNPSRMYIVLPAAAMAGILFLRYPQIGLIILIPASVLIPFTIGPAFISEINNAILFLGALIGLWVLDMLVIKREFSVRLTRPVYAILGLCAASILAFIVGQLPWFSISRAAPLQAQLAGLAIFLLSAGAFLLAANQMNEAHWLEWMCWVFLATGGLIVFLHVIPGIGPLFKSLLPESSTGSLFWVWLVAIAFSQVVLNKNLTTGPKLFLLTTLSLTFFYLLFMSRGWASGWFPSITAILVILLLWKPRLGIGMIIVLGAVFLFKYQLIINTIMGFEEYSAYTRFEAWRIMLEMIKVNPIFGFGPANYRFYTHLFPILGYYIEFNSHNQYLDIIAQVGLVGFGFFTWFVWEIGKLGIDLSSRLPNGFPKAYAIGALGGLAGTLVAGMLGDWFIPFVYNIGLEGFRASLLGWLFLGGLVAFNSIYQDRKQVS